MGSKIRSCTGTGVLLNPVLTLSILSVLSIVFTAGTAFGQGPARPQTLPQLATADPT
jgi:hypothetical protein